MSQANKYRKHHSRMAVISLHVREKSVVIVGNGCAGAECIKALRENGIMGNWRMVL